VLQGHWDTTLLKLVEICVSSSSFVCLYVVLYYVLFYVVLFLLLSTCLLTYNCNEMVIIIIIIIIIITWEKVWRPQTPSFPCIRVHKHSNKQNLEFSTIIRYLSALKPFRSRSTQTCFYRRHSFHFKIEYSSYKFKLNFIRKWKLYFIIKHEIFY
jgi:hypothetical protein